MGSKLRAPALLTVWTAALSLALVAATPVASAAPGEPTAKERVARGLEFYQAGNYDEAIAEFERAYAASNSAAILFPWAQAERLRGNCRQAVDLYQRFIDSKPPTKQVEAATRNRKECEERLQSTDAVAATIVPGEAGDVSAPEPEPEPVQEPEPEPEPPPPPPPPRWRTDAAGWTLLGVGAAATIAGGAVLGLAQRSEADAADAPTYGDFADLKESAATQRIAGGVVLGVGAALLLAGVIRLALSGRTDARPQARVRPRGLGLEGRF